MHSEIAAFLAPSLVKLAQRDGRGMNFEFTREISEILFDRLRTNQLDVALAVTAPGDPQDSLAKWNMPMSWIAAPGYTPPVNGPVPLITTPESSLYDKIAASALRKADRTFEIVCKGANDDVLKSAVDAGYGVCVRPSSWAPQGAHFVPASQIAALPDVTLGLFAPNGRSSEASRPLFARMINLLSASEALGGH
jgi:DNA-binding transcriptional LysR family regulator